LTLSVTDQPGRADGDGRDRQFANDLVEYLRGIEFVNVFFLVKTSLPPRWDANFQKMLQELTEMLGTRVWEHIVIVLTGARDGSMFTPEYRKGVYEELRRTVDMGDFDPSKLKIFALELHETETGEHTYKKKLAGIIGNVVPKYGRFSCEGLVSPIDNLKNDVDAAQLDYDDEKLQWQAHLATDESYAKQIQEIAKKMHALDASFEIEDGTFAFPSVGVKLDVEETMPVPSVSSLGLDRSADDDDDEKEAEGKPTIGAPAVPKWRCSRCGMEGNESIRCESCTARFDEHGEKMETPMWECEECFSPNVYDDEICTSCGDGECPTIMSID